MTECVFSGNETGSVECDLTIIPHHCRCDYVSFDPLCSTVSRINYLHFPACTSRDAQIMAMIALGAWAVYLFSALAVIVDHGVVVNLVQISKILRLSEVLAGVTLLALGNGIADIFTAVSAVRSSPNGGALAVSGLLGSALFVISVNTGVLAIKYEPKASRDLLSRDSFFFVISLGWVSYVLWDHSLYAWQAAVLICIYLVYVGTVLAQDVQNQRHWLQASTKHGNGALSQSPSIVASRTTSPASSIHEDFAYESDGSDLVEDPEARLLLGLNGQGSPGSYGTSPVDEDQASPSHGPIVEPVFSVRSSGGGNRAATPSVNDVATRAPPDHTQADSTAAALAARSYVLVSELVPDSMGVRDLFMVEVRRLFPFKSDQPAWKTALVVIQSPVRLLLLCTVPVVQFEAANENSAWNKWLVIFQTICSTTVVAVVVADDAFRAPQHASHKVPLAVFAAVTGILLACLLALTSGQNRLPIYRHILPFWGFAVASVLVFAVTDELVAVLRGFGSWFGLSPAFLGMIVLGIGNGLTDLIANLIVSEHGWPAVAVSAIYGSSVLNLLVGIALAALIGVTKYGDPYTVSFDLQNLLGMCTNVLALAVTVAFVWLSKTGNYFRQKCGICLLLVYALFLAGSITIEAYKDDVQI